MIGNEPSRTKLWGFLRRWAMTHWPGVILLQGAAKHLEAAKPGLRALILVTAIIPDECPKKHGKIDILFVDVQGEGIGKMMETYKYPGVFNWPWQRHRTYGMLPFSESSSYLFSRKLRCFSFRIEEHFPDAEVPHALLKPEELPVTVEMETPIESVEVEEVTVPPSKDQVDTPQVGLRWTKNTCHLLNLPTFLSKMDEHMLYLKKRLGSFLFEVSIWCLWRLI